MQLLQNESIDLHLSFLGEKCSLVVSIINIAMGTDVPNYNLQFYHHLEFLKFVKKFVSILVYISMGIITLITMF